MITERKNDAIAGKVLIVDDDPQVAEVLLEFLTEEGHDTTISLTGAEAKAQIQSETYDVILTDLRLPDLDKQERRYGGLKLLEFVKQTVPSIEVIIISGHGTLHSIKEAIRAGAYDFIVKPPGWDEVIQTVESALVKRRLKLRRNQLAREVAQNHESEMRKLLQLYDQLDREMKNARAAHQELFDLATRDGLTGLYNYRYFHTQLEALMPSKPTTGPHRRHQHPETFSLVMVDIDHFKAYNDKHGHLKGNEILREIAQILASNIRETDIAARYGGEEFVIILRETDKERAVAFAERCVGLVCGYSFDATNPNNKLTISAGVATASQDATAPDDLIAQADKALYAAKEAGRNQVQVAGE
ncbi:MAG: diguanylate cyclase [Candidatus Poribacteria bacterium]|nr:diguanylate cyclase [Candidatus Poribacteria bacterium]